MSTSVSLNGTTYTIPATGENTWGDNVSSYLIALGSGVLQKAGGSFTLTAEVDFGATYGLKSAYYKSRGTNPASAGEVRLANAEYVKWRNAANSADLGLRVNSSNQLEFNGTALYATALGTANQVLGVNSGATGQEYKTLSGTSNQVTVTHGTGTITLSTPQDIASGSSPTFAGVTLSGLTASRVMVTDGSKAAASSAVTATELGYLSGVTTPTGSGALVLATSPTLVTPNIGAATGTSLQLSGLTASRAMVTDASKNLASSAVTSTELGYLSGVTTPTGSGALVLATSPTLVTPTLGVATATSINKVAITAPATGSTLTLADGKTLTVSNTLTFTGTDSSSVAFGSGGTVAYTSNKLSAFASTTSSELAGVVSDKTGSGALVFGTTPTLATPVITTAATFNAQAELRLADSDSSNYVGFKAPATVSANKIWTLPSADGGANQVLSTDGAGTLQWATASGSGGINYISANADFENNTTTGWATYADAAATTPADGTGGSPNCTFAASSSSPLRGSYSGLFTKGAANRQGEGFSYAFTIASADVSRPLLITWEGEASANYTGSSGSEYLSVYVYDVTNATLISPASTTVAPGTSKGSTFFVATTSTSYRLIFHVAGTGTSSWTYKIDTVSVGPQSIAMGPALTDWQSFTPTWGNFSGSLNASSFAMWRRVGDSMEIQFDARISSFTSMGALNLTIPGGYTFNSTYKGDGTATDFGHVTYYDDSANVLYNGKITANSSTFTQLDLYAVTGTAGNAVSSTFPFTWANSDRWSGFCRIPISQWSSSNFQSADRAVELFAYNTTVTDATDTTSFGYGPVGSQFGNFTAARTKRVRFQQPIQPTDSIAFEFTLDGGTTWFRLGEGNTDYLSIRENRNGTAYGVELDVVNSTDVDVKFGTYATSAGATTFGGAGQTYAAIDNDNTYRWRVRKVSGGASVGFPVGSQNLVGRVDGVAPSAGYVGQVISATITTTTSTVTGGTEVDCTDASLPLTAGSWMIYSAANIGLINASGSSRPIVGRVRVTDSSNTYVTGTSFLMQQYIGAGHTHVVNATITSPPININASTTYKLRITCTDSSASGIVRLYGADQGNFTGTENECTFFAVRIA